jgi:hypothetical protein
MQLYVKKTINCCFIKTFHGIINSHKDIIMKQTLSWKCKNPQASQNIIQLQRVGLIQSTPKNSKGN